MLMYEIIAKKRDKRELSAAEIGFWIKGASAGSIPDYQSAALLMAIRLNGLNMNETLALVEEMTNSGGRLDLQSIPGQKVDKHSTGGVGDKTTLIAMPIMAAGGLKVAKMSGRGLGHTGGTLDKLEAIPGFNTQLGVEEFTNQVREIDIAISGQTEQLAPADKLLYSLRDLTATVDSIPLIAASIMSKKLATGADILVLDVKFGSGAILTDVAAARELAQLMIEISKAHNMRVAAVLSSMQQPLGYTVGNALELLEAMDVLQGRGAADLRTVSLNLAAEAFLLAGISADKKTALLFAEQLLQSGAAYDKFRQMIAAQTGKDGLPDLPQAPLIMNYTAARDGYISAMQTQKIGFAALQLGAGRSRKEQQIDHAAGIVFTKKLAESVQKGETLASLHCRSQEQYQAAKELLDEAIIIKDRQPDLPPLLEETLY